MHGKGRTCALLALLFLYACGQNSKTPVETPESSAAKPEQKTPDRPAAAIPQAGSPVAVAPEAPRRALAERIPDAPGLPNFARLHAGLYRGAQPTRAGLEHLKALGVRTVISLRSWHHESKDVEACGMRCLALPVQAGLLGSEPPSEKEVESFFKTVLDPACQPVFFHCAEGKDRTGTLAALYRIEIDGWTTDEAIEEMRAFGYHEIYKDLLDFVRRYRPRGFIEKMKGEK